MLKSLQRTIYIEVFLNTLITISFLSILSSCNTRVDKGVMNSSIKPDGIDTEDYDDTDELKDDESYTDAGDDEYAEEDTEKDNEAYVAEDNEAYEVKDDPDTTGNEDSENAFQDSSEETDAEGLSLTEEYEDMGSEDSSLDQEYVETAPKIRQNTAPEFSLDGAVAFSLSLDSIPTEKGETNLFKVYKNKSLSPASNIRVSEVYPSKSGTLIFTEMGKRILIKKDGTIDEVSINAPYKGVSGNGDHVFEDLSIYRASQGKIDWLETNLLNPKVQMVSGSLLVLSGDKDKAQVFNIKNKAKFNLTDCYDPQAIAISSKKALINGCGVDSQILDLSNGSLKPIDTSPTNGAWGTRNHEWAKASDGVILLQKSCVPGSKAYNLCHVNKEGVISALSKDEFDPAASGYTGSIGNQNLFVDGDYIIVKEATQISLVERKVRRKVPILLGFNVTTISVNQGEVYFVADDSFGNPIGGVYNIKRAQTLLVIGEGKFREIKAIPN